MNLLLEVKLVVAQINKLNPEDPKIYEHWKKLAELLSADERSTISLLNNLNDCELIEDISSVFDDVSGVLQSKDFISCLESLEERYPNLVLEYMVKAARDALID